MRALLLAAGLGTRLRPITNDIPKCLVPIDRKPLLQYWLDLLLPSKVSHIHINTHYFADKVRDFIIQTDCQDAVILTHEDSLLGTGGTVLNHRQWLSDSAFLVAHADNLTRFSVNDFIAVHEKRAKDVAITMMTFDTDNPQSCGIIETDERGIVTQLYEKSAIYRGTRANAAVYIFEPTVIDFIASLDKPVVDLSTEVLPHYLGKMQIFHNDDYHRDIGTPQSLQLAELEFSAKKA